MSETVPQEAEGTNEEVANLPPPRDPENPDHAPEDPEADTVGPSDDEVTGGGDEDDADGADEHGEPAPAAPTPPDTESRLDEVAKRLSTAGRNYGKRVADILGEDWLGIVPCPLCMEHYPGLLTPAPASDETIQQVRPLIGLPDLSTYREDTYARRCDRCGGLGKTLTGSRVPEYATMRCPQCKGAGFLSSEQSVPAAPAVNGHEEVPAPTHVDDVPPVGMPQASIDALQSMLDAARNQGVATIP